jgi:aldose 1-epimerase
MSLRAAAVPPLGALVYVLVAGAGCDRQASESVTATGRTLQAAPVTRAHFGNLPDGTAIEELTLTNASGDTVKLITYGGIITSINVRDRDGRRADVVLGHDTLADYLRDDSYFGAIIGRYANRIGGSRFAIDGQTYSLSANDGRNSLHGGFRGLDKVVWNAQAIEAERAAAVRLSHTSPDGDGGYPGALSVSVVYAFNDRGELAIDYEATTDKPTVVNLTNHSYFNLSGEGSGDVLGSVLTLYADRYTPVDEELIPTGAIESVDGTPLDFRTPTAIGARIRDARLIELAKGYDHNFVLNRGGAGEVKAAEVFDPRSGRVLEVFTTEPGVQLYLANHQDGNVGKAGHVYNQYAAFCLETQHYPDSPNKQQFPSTILRPGETYRSRTVYAFSVR